MKINSAKVFNKCFFPSVLSGVTSLLVVQYVLKWIVWFDSTFVNFLCEGFAFAIFYVAFVYVFVMNKEDKSFFLKLVRK